MSVRPDVWAQLVCAGAGGFCGAVARFTVTVGMKKLVPGFPLGTMFVNLLGCLLMGAVMGATQESRSLSPPVRSFLTIGLLGSFTTFATFSQEGYQLIRERSHGSALIYVVGSVVLGLLLFLVGSELAIRFSQRS
ncbi:MAG: fluoride efflux transporter CrcB [Planctomycetes bacterium]|nr:fluoride efflux transporter CrcB [Planctomycetota bacterium]